MAKSLISYIILRQCSIKNGSRPPLGEAEIPLKIEYLSFRQPYILVSTAVAPSNNGADAIYFVIWCVKFTSMQYSTKKTTEEPLS